MYIYTYIAYLFEYHSYANNANNHPALLENLKFQKCSLQ